MNTSQTVELPGLDCGLCGFKTCVELKAKLDAKPELVERCIHISEFNIGAQAGCSGHAQSAADSPACGECHVCAPAGSTPAPHSLWKDSLGRDFDFYLEHFPEDKGPREIIIPHNPLITREMEVAPGDILIGRPLGMSCGCPVTHCGEATAVDKKTGVITWCVTGPLEPRRRGFKDIGYYSAEAYEGLAMETKVELRIGMRYYFQPRMCMLQWRHSGLINYLNRTPEGVQVRLEGLFIG